MVVLCLHLVFHIFYSTSLTNENVWEAIFHVASKLEAVMVCVEFEPFHLGSPAVIPPWIQLTDCTNFCLVFLKTEMFSNL